LHVRRLGRVEYADGLALQKLLVAARAQDLVPDTLLLLEHPRVITLGRGARGQNVLWSPALLEERGFEVFETDRGGDVTYHGPGQLVGYPILKLVERDLHKYLRDLEAGLIGVCARFGIEGARKAGWTGVWIGEKKVASIGIAVRRWVTMHGFALNVATDLSRFTAINPCGLDAAVMTSLSREAGRDVTLDEVKPLVVARMASVFGRAFG